MKKPLALMLAAGLVLSAFVAPNAVAGKKKKKSKSGPVVVGKDEVGDWGKDNATGEDISAFGDAAGMDLVEAVIEMADAETINFIIKVNSLPSGGGMPEVPRYIWSADVDGEYIELDGKYTNYSRGACDPTAGTCPPPRDPGQQPFLVRGNCTTDGTANVTTCQELGFVKATFDVANATITIPVPMDMINAKYGSKISAGGSSFTSQAGGPVLAIPAAFVSRSDFPRDSLLVEKTFVVSAKAKK